MGKALKWVGIGVGAIVALTALVVAYVAATFNPNDYKADIIKAVQDKTGRTLKLTGDLKLALYPSIGAKVGEASLSEPKSDKEFAAFKDAVVSVKVMPLLGKQVVVDAIELKGLRASITKDKNGKFNFDDLTGGEKKGAKPEAQSAVKVDIDHVDITDADVSYLDEADGKRYRLSKLDLKTGHIAPGATTPIDFSANIASEKDKTALDTKMKAKLTIDTGREVYKADGLDLSVKGKYGGGDLVLTVKAPELTMTKEKTAGSFNAEVEMKSEGRTIKAKLESPLSGDLNAKRFELPKLTLTAKVTDPKLPKGSFDASITGAARADLAKDTASLDFSGKLDESNVSGKAGVTKFSPLTLTFDFTADQLDVDRLMGKQAGKPAETKESQAPAVAKSAKDEKIDLSALHAVNATGNVKIGKLNAFNIKSTQVSTGIKLAGGRLDVSPIAAQLYDGTMKGSLSAQATATPVFTIKQNLAGISVGPLLRDAAKVDNLEGKGTVNVDVTTQGATVDALKRALGGTASLNLADGALKGIDIAGTIRNARDKIQQLRGQQVQQSNKSQKTDFSELKATFNIKNGVASNNDLSMKSPLLRVAGSGDIDIGNDKMNYLLKPTLVATSQGQGGKERSDVTGLTVPVKLTGPIASPDYSIDFAGMATDVAKSAVTSEIAKRIPGGLGQMIPGASKPADTKAADTKGGAAKPGGGIGDQLKGIFGR